jgi:response regulator RpfG family c-di-GMP phosphodiesterase
MSDRVLFVDDEANVLSAFQRHLRKQFRISTALGGAQGLELIETRGPFAVIVSDMRMPEMDGIQFLATVRERTPDSVRMMLTGNADQQTAVDAVNKGNIFRFLTKPCSPDYLVASLEAAIEQHRLITAERELVEGTLNGALRLLTDILSMVDPESFGRSIQLREMASGIASTLGMVSTADLEMAATLSQIGIITIPPEILAREREGERLDEEEQKMLMRIPEAGRDLLAHIPRMDTVARVVQYQNKHLDGSGFPPDAVAGDEIPIESRILKVLADLVELEHEGHSREAALERMRGQPGFYDPRVLEAAANPAGGGDRGPGATVDLRITELRAGQVLMASIENDEGRLLFGAGQRITPAVVERLRNYSRIMKINEPIRVQLAPEE